MERMSIKFISVKIWKKFGWILFVGLLFIIVQFIPYLLPAGKSIYGIKISENAKILDWQSLSRIKYPLDYADSVVVIIPVQEWDSFKRQLEVQETIYYEGESLFIEVLKVGYLDYFSGCDSPVPGDLEDFKLPDEMKVRPVSCYFCDVAEPFDWLHVEVYRYKKDFLVRLYFDKN